MLDFLHIGLCGLAEKRDKLSPEAARTRLDETKWRSQGAHRCGEILQSPVTKVLFLLASIQRTIEAEKLQEGGGPRRSAG